MKNRILKGLKVKKHKLTKTKKTKKKLYGTMKNCS